MILSLVSLEDWHAKTFILSPKSARLIRKKVTMRFAAETFATQSTTTDTERLERRSRALEQL